MNINIVTGVPILTAVVVAMVLDAFGVTSYILVPAAVIGYLLARFVVTRYP